MKNHTFGFGNVNFETVFHAIVLQRVYCLLEFFGRVSNDRKVVGKHKVFDESVVNAQAFVRETVRVVVYE